MTSGKRPEGDTVQEHVEPLRVMGVFDPQSYKVRCERNFVGQLSSEDSNLAHKVRIAVSTSEQQIIVFKKKIVWYLIKSA